MTLPLPPVVETYYAAETAEDWERFGRCFSEDAVVHDEGGTYRGPAAIKAWMMAAKEKYHAIAEPLAAKADGATLTVTTRLTGPFPGSPIEVPFRFVLTEGKIGELKIG